MYLFDSTKARIKPSMALKDNFRPSCLVTQVKQIFTCHKQTPSTPVGVKRSTVMEPIFLNVHWIHRVMISKHIQCPHATDKAQAQETAE